jgi:hypothetical protein
MIYMSKLLPKLQHIFTNADKGNEKNNNWVKEK